MSFTIAIIGRPNVGKSTLFNRLVGQKLALVDDEPGVTRDRREGEGRLGDLEFTVVDTAGLDEGAKGSLTARMQEQTEAAIALADALMFVIDARAGLTPNDRAFADFARRADKPVILVANKAEGKHGEIGAMESYALGLGDPIQISAEHGEGLSDLYDALRGLMPEPVDEPKGELQDEPQEFDDDDVIAQDEDIAKRPIRVAIVGRPNAGKSTLINHLLGEERLLTSPDAGTTRDSISVEIKWKDRDFRVFDTAGLRRRSRIEEKLEKLSVADALRAVRFAEVVVLAIDAQHKFEEQDLRIADLIEREGRALVIAVNKWDLMAAKPAQISALRTEADHLLPQVRGVPVVAVSGLMGEGIDRLMSAIEEAYAVWNKRVATAALNRWFEQAVDANPPPAVSGRRLKLNYITQTKARPPSFVLFCSRADAVPQSYLRYLVNSLREVFELPGTPVRITLREKANPFAHKRRRPS
jgi:GTP-binding protein